MNDCDKVGVKEDLSWTLALTKPYLAWNTAAVHDNE